MVRVSCIYLKRLLRHCCVDCDCATSRYLQMFGNLQKNLSAKSTTQAVRCAYVSLVSHALRHCRPAPAQRAALAPTLARAVEKAAQQPLQHLVVSEGICAMLGLVLLDESRELPGKAALWAALAHVDRQVLLHDRVLSAASDDGESVPRPLRIARSSRLRLSSAAPFNFKSFRRFLLLQC